LVEDGPITTSGGITSYLDLALRLVGRHCGDEVRQALARVMLLDAARPSQVPYISAALLAERRFGFMERVDAWMQEHLEQPFDASLLAAHCSVSTRTLLRRIRKATDTSPLSYLQRLRIERAKALLETSNLPAEEIAKRCGYQDISAFRKLFKRITQLTPKHYRERFSLRR
jgi:transcriptional regulator GlxA family with amidase domain